MSLWTLVVEPLLRQWPGYPPDWERRRMFAFERAHGRCERCGVPAGRIALANDAWRVTGAHVHHVTPLSRGGTHALHNLSVRCVECHRAEHPGNTAIGMRSPQR